MNKTLKVMTQGDITMVSHIQTQQQPIIARLHKSPWAGLSSRKASDQRLGWPQ